MSWPRPPLSSTVAAANKGSGSTFDLKGRETYGVLEFLVQILNDSSETARGHVEVMVETLSGFVIAVVAFCLWRELVLDQGEHLGGVEERGKDSRGHGV